MNLPKIILTTDKNIKELVSKKYILNYLKEDNKTEVFESKNKEIILIFCENNIKKATKYLLDNYIFEKIIYI
jgi:hypothetical protein